uniref:Uncharacterized protein n=1 Tax=Glossina palpalis gambiensis TaxID=67801 RepID=A0A1B0BA14_9MUSC
MTKEWCRRHEPNLRQPQEPANYKPRNLGNATVDTGATHILSYLSSLRRNSTDNTLNVNIIPSKSLPKNQIRPLLPCEKGNLDPNGIARIVNDYNAPAGFKVVNKPNMTTATKIES